jgi:hypothetical protein
MNIRSLNGPMLGNVKEALVIRYPIYFFPLLIANDA